MSENPVTVTVVALATLMWVYIGALLIFIIVSTCCCLARNRTAPVVSDEAPQTPIATEPITPTALVPNDETACSASAANHCATETISTIDASNQFITSVNNACPAGVGHPHHSHHRSHHHGSYRNCIDITDFEMIFKPEYKY